MNLIKLPKGLTLEEGVSYEELIAKLQKANIDHRLLWKDPLYQKGDYFREPTISVDKDHFDMRKVREILGKPHQKQGYSDFYLAMYRPNNEFDWTQLTGVITLNKGRLVQRTRIEYF